MTTLKIEKLSKNISKKSILKDINLLVHTGVYGILGPNGAGKTTLFRCITALYDSKFETIKLDDTSIKDKGYTYNIGYLPQSFHAFKEMSVEQMLHFFCNMKKLKKETIDDEIKSALEKTHLVQERKKKVGAISGGMLRRLGIAQAMLGSPKLILLDEPTVGLDPDERRRFWDIINSQGKESIILFSTHIIDDVKNVCDNIIIMNNGKICACDDVNVINKQMQGHVYTCDQSQLGDIQGKYELVKHGKTMRVVTENMQELEACEPEIEDSYIWYTKQLNAN